MFYDYMTFRKVSNQLLLHQGLWTYCSTKLLGWELQSWWLTPVSDNRIATYISYLLLHNKLPQKLEGGQEQQICIISQLLWGRNLGWLRWTFWLSISHKAAVRVLAWTAVISRLLSWITPFLPHSCSYCQAIDDLLPSSQMAIAWLQFLPGIWLKVSVPW